MPKYPILLQQEQTVGEQSRCMYMPMVFITDKLNLKKQPLLLK